MHAALRCEEFKLADRGAADQCARHGLCLKPMVAEAFGEGALKRTRFFMSSQRPR